jgi:hypothetical protein
MKRTSAQIATFAWAAWALFGTGCGAAPDGGTDGTTPGGAPAQPGAVIHRTIVTQEPDGTTTVRERDITQEEHDRDIAARTLMMQGVRPYSVIDFSCASSSMWLFSQPNLSGAEICIYPFSSDGFWHDLDLATLPFGFWGDNWAGRVRSFWAGADEACFHTSEVRHCNLCVDPYGRRDAPTNEWCGTFDLATVLTLRCHTCPYPQP